MMQMRQAVTKSAVQFNHGVKASHNLSQSDGQRSSMGVSHNPHSYTPNAWHYYGYFDDAMPIKTLGDSTVCLNQVVGRFVDFNKWHNLDIYTEDRSAYLQPCGMLMEKWKIDGELIRSFTDIFAQPIYLCLSQDPNTNGVFLDYCNKHDVNQKWNFVGDDAFSGKHLISKASGKCMETEPQKDWSTYQHSTLSGKIFMNTCKQTKFQQWYMQKPWRKSAADGDSIVINLLKTPNPADSKDGKQPIPDTSPTKYGETVYRPMFQRYYRCMDDNDANCEECDPGNYDRSESDKKHGLPGKFDCWGECGTTDAPHSTKFCVRLSQDSKWKRFVTKTHVECAANFDVSMSINTLLGTLDWKVDGLSLKQANGFDLPTTDKFHLWPRVRESWSQFPTAALTSHYGKSEVSCKMKHAGGHTITLEFTPLDPQARKEYWATFNPSHLIGAGMWYYPGWKYEEDPYKETRNVIVEDMVVLMKPDYGDCMDKKACLKELDDQGHDGLAFFEDNTQVRECLEREDHQLVHGSICKLWRDCLAQYGSTETQQGMQKLLEAAGVGEACTEDYVHCGSWAAAGYCTDNQYGAWVQQHCSCKCSSQLAVSDGGSNQVLLKELATAVASSKTVVKRSKSTEGESKTLADHECMNPDTEDPAAWQCDCWEEMQKRCEQVNHHMSPNPALKTCLRAQFCLHPKVCSEWTAAKCHSSDVKEVMAKLQATSSLTQLTAMQNRSKEGQSSVQVAQRERANEFDDTMGGKKCK
eukprot:gnl/TRDRNA2_/TRDRNA2_168778_c1_seq20.p1 gnl/TRDRNA2_/TRDRNA2_168778_c1~~gnl/TRDRNA2_/TRDRNA2_168778_c1_seq20.p1  ORF type:complete len:817 (-),score=96.32 gnl/TRDRNA2_/TRDRNA2_168778_c1_seq20:123-2378(-)